MRGKELRYIASGDYVGRIATSHHLWEGSVIALNRHKYRVKSDPYPTIESDLKMIDLEVIEIHAVEI